MLRVIAMVVTLLSVDFLSDDMELQKNLGKRLKRVVTKKLYLHKFATPSRCFHNDVVVLLRQLYVGTLKLSTSSGKDVGFQEMKALSSFANVGYLQIR